MRMLLTSLLLSAMFFAASQQQQQQQQQPQITNRIECKSEPERDSTYYVLNCTLMSAKFEQEQLTVSQQQPQQYVSQTSIEVTSNDGLKVGQTPMWKTPWDDIQLNYDIIKTFIWKSSRLSYIGEYTFKDLTMLETIDLSSNRIYEVNPNAFKSFEVNLHELDLSGNLFETIPTYLFQVKVLQALEVFKFNDNRISRLHNRTFDNLPKLKHLELNNCFLKEIDVGAFYNLKSMEYLSLNGNHLKSVSEATLKDLSLRYLYLNDNLFICDCNLRWLLTYLKTLDMYRHNILLASTIALKCAEPNSLKSKQNFLEINPDSFMCDVQLSGSPQVNETYAERAYDYGDDIVLRCEIYADPEPLIYWMFGNKRLEKALSDDFNLKYQINEQYKFKSLRTNKTSELHIKNLQYTDIGTYTCIGEISGTTNRKQMQFNLKNFIRQTNFTNLFHSKYLTNLTLLILLISIAVIIFIFTVILIVYICVKCKRLKRKQHDRSSSMVDDEENNEEILANNFYSNDEFDSKLPNCIRYAQQKAATATTCNSDDKYTLTDALLNNSSSTIVHNHNNIYQPSHRMLLHNGEHHLLPPAAPLPQHMMESGCYYDDLRMPYDDVLFLPIDEQHNKNQHHQDGHSMLYGTVMSQSQHNKLLTPIYGTINNRNPSTGYYSQIPAHQQQSMTLLSSSSSSTAAAGPGSRIRTSTNQPPPSKPKRTFEYSQPLLQQQHQHQQQPLENGRSSSSTLDDEDLDLNDLKDFEDVTFDNLRKPVTNGYRAKQQLQHQQQQQHQTENGDNKRLLPITHNLNLDNKHYEETEI